MLITQSTRSSTPFIQTVSPFWKFYPQFFYHFYLYPAPITTVIGYPFFNILELFLVFIYHNKQILILKETSNYMTLLFNNSSRRKTSWLCTKNDVRLQPRSQEEAGWSKATDIRIANYVLRPTLVLFAIIRKLEMHKVNALMEILTKVSCHQSIDKERPDFRKIYFRSVKLWNSLGLSA